MRSTKLIRRASFCLVTLLCLLACTEERLPPPPQPPPAPAGGSAAPSVSEGSVTAGSTLHAPAAGAPAMGGPGPAAGAPAAATGEARQAVACSGTLPDSLRRLLLEKHPAFEFPNDLTDKVATGDFDGDGACDFAVLLMSKQDRPRLGSLIAARHDPKTEWVIDTIVDSQESLSDDFISIAQPGDYERDSMGQSEPVEPGEMLKYHSPFEGINRSSSGEQGGRTSYFFDAGKWIYIGTEYVD